MATYNVQFDKCVCAMDGNTHLVANFTIAEMANKTAKDDVKLVITPRVVKFLMMMQEMRDWYGKSITVNSWYRTTSFNKSCGGASNSLHLDGLAMDWGIKGQTAAQRKSIMNKWKSICNDYGEIGGINYYTNGYHLDIGEEKFGNKKFTIRDYRGLKGDW